MLANGVFAGAEIAVVSLRKSRLRELVEEGSRGARAVQRLRDEPERFFATVQVAITVIGATAGAFGGATWARDLEPGLRKIPGLALHAEGIALAVVVAVISYLSLVLGELVPKSLALRTSEGYSLLVGRPLLGLSWLARPLVWLLTTSSNAILRIFGDRTTFSESRLSSDELQLLLDEATKAGSLHPQAGDIASRAIGFGELTAMEVMVPRSQVVALAKSAAAEEVTRVVLGEGHSRMPVYDGTLDNVVGYLAVKDILPVALERGQVQLERLLRPALFVPETMRAVDLLREMQSRRTHLVIVVDEQGSMAGIVTTEDLIEELVGEIASEQENKLPEPIRRQPDGSALVQGTIALRDINRALSLDLPEGESWTTIAGLCNALAGRIPQKGDRLTAGDGTQIEILDASPRRVRAVRLRPATAPPAPTPDDAPDDAHHDEGDR